MKALWGLSHHKAESPTNRSVNRTPVEIRRLQDTPITLLNVKNNLERDADYFVKSLPPAPRTPKERNYQTLELPRLVELNEQYVKDNTRSSVEPTTLPSHDISSNNREKIRLNIRGHRYETFVDTLARFPNTLLGCSEKREQFYEYSTRQYSFGPRDLSSFNAILFYYQSNGILSRPADVTSQTFYNEICFFQLGENAIKLYLQREGMETPKSLPEIDISSRRRGVEIWRTLEYPTHSLLAQIFAILSLAIICLSIIIYCGETLPSIRKNPAQKSAFYCMEIFCMSWFTLEYIIRVLVSPNRKKFCFSAIGFIDLSTIFPFYVTLIAVEANYDLNHEKLCCIFRVLKLLRVLRVLKFSRYVQGINILAQTLLRSSNEIGLLLLCIFIAALLFATLAYNTDISADDTEIHSIPDGIWFAIISLTCIGYGDIVPVTNLGKFNASVCMLTGLVVLSLPTPVIVHNFIKLFYNRKKKELSISEGYMQ